MRLLSLLTLLLLGRCLVSQCSAAIQEPGALAARSIPTAQFEFGSLPGQRIQANVEHWLLRAPQANPGMLEMFRLRDRQPVPQLVPWAGEFVGKYLISGIQGLRLSTDPRLEQQISNVVRALIATQAEDGYLGPFPRDLRLLRNWDLWGHYHAIQALLLWHERTADDTALAAARRAGDLVCQTFLGTGRRVLDAGDPEMNMAITTGLLLLHRHTGEPRYLQMAREVERDWEKAGDYLRAGLDGREFFQSPRPRWESLHSLQALLEFWRVTGDARYRDAFIHHWRSIRRWDRRNTGGFSSGEQATGNPFAPSAIETCCTVAWMTLTLDYLKLTGDPIAADDLELSTLNGGLGAQHPSGRWWTYNTPMDGAREASAHTIVFQSRAGTPELNCCSVNAPRVLGLLSEWVVMSNPAGLAIHWYAPFSGQIKTPSGAAMRLEVTGDYPREPRGTLRVQLNRPEEFTLRLRIPGWTESPRIQLRSGNATQSVPATPGVAASLRRTWADGDVIEFEFPMPIRFTPGAQEAVDRVSLYRGPVLLAYDQSVNPFDDSQIPGIRLGRLATDSVVLSDSSTPGPAALGAPELSPWMRIQVPTEDPARPLVLVDFASAGAAGTRYRTWLPTAQPSSAVASTPPPPAFTQYPRDGARVRPGPTLFQWRGPKLTNDLVAMLQSRFQGYRIEFSTNGLFDRQEKVYLSNSNRVTLNTADLGKISSWRGPISWRVVRARGNYDSLPDVPPAQFTLDPDAPVADGPVEIPTGPRGEMVRHALRTGNQPEWGKLESPAAFQPSPSGTTLNGRDQRLIYALAGWPEEDWTVAVRVRIDELPSQRIGQIFSAWSGSMDDPLRLTVDGGRINARIEAGSGASTPSTPARPGAWQNLVAVKHDATVTFYADGKSIGSCVVPASMFSQTRACALGGNPRYSGNEYLAATYADLEITARAWSEEEVRNWGK
ncbi:MAG: glycoside hydrolase family 127 protein [Verrucomicrobiales bacterium]|nr:glycoside hydrolase family 127 protein [Verrucomicrobiales bacterium]